MHPSFYANYPEVSRLSSNQNRNGYLDKRSNGLPCPAWPLLLLIGTQAEDFSTNSALQGILLKESPTQTMRWFLLNCNQENPHKPRWLGLAWHLD